MRCKYKDDNGFCSVTNKKCYKYFPEEYCIECEEVK